MSKDKLTPWFPGDVKPTRKGVYEVSEDNNRWYSYWNGKTWGWISMWPDIAYDRRNNFKFSPKQMGDWRGLAQDPKAKL